MPALKTYARNQRELHSTSSFGSRTYNTLGLGQASFSSELYA
jgi:hypothetical protein